MKFIFLDSVHPVLAERLEGDGIQCDYDTESDEKVLSDKLFSYSGLVVRSRIKISKAFIKSGKNLKYIIRIGSGMENVDVDYAESQGIACINSPEGNRNAVGEHALGLLLGLLNHITRANNQIKEQNLWQREKNRGVELEGKTVAIIGYGNTGSAFAEKLSGFHCNIIVYDKYKKDFGSSIVKIANMNELYKKADVLSLHIPLTTETRYLIDKDFISRFVKPVYFINTSRGEIVKTKDLIHHIETGKIIGAGLDVLEFENHNFEIEKRHKVAFEKLKQLDQVILTPHIAGWTEESKYKLSTVAYKKIKQLLPQNYKKR